MPKLLYEVNADWNLELIADAMEEIEKIANEELKIPYYTPQIEVVSSEQMIDAYAAVGMPIFYKHWSFGKEFSTVYKAYSKGRMHLAYEMVINSEPCIAYLMEENNMNMQTMVIAHALIGHSGVFKNNYMFKDHTDATSIINYLVFAKNYLQQCEARYGEDEVEELLDACHALKMFSMDKHPRKSKSNNIDEEKIALEKFEQELADYNPLWEMLIKKQKKQKTIKDEIKFPPEPEDNLLHFIEKNAPMLPPWKRQVIRIVRKIAQYFYPQVCTKVVNEGYATFCHYYIMTRLYEKGLICEGSYMEFLASHTAVINQPPYYRYSQINPYSLGFAIFMDIKRMCEHPTAEDREYFPDIAGKNWVEEVNYAMSNFKDDTFILQYLSPKVVRDFKFFHFVDRDKDDFYYIQNIQNEEGFYKVRETLARRYDLSVNHPIIKITDVDVSGDRMMTLEHEVVNEVPLEKESAMQTLMHVAKLWEFRVQIHTIKPNELEEDDTPTKFRRIYSPFGSSVSHDEPDKVDHGPQEVTYIADGKYSCPEGERPTVWEAESVKKTETSVLKSGKIILRP
jgi:stage V sporulation protein R